MKRFESFLLPLLLTACQVTAPDARTQQVGSGAPTQQPTPATQSDPPAADETDPDPQPETQTPEQPKKLEKKGKVTASKLVRTYSKKQLETLLGDDGFGLPITHGAQVYKLDYETQAPKGKVVKARTLVLIPDGSTQNLPLLAYNHGTTGMADGCEPSAYPGYEESFLSYAARGVAVSATDYAGLGTPGTHYYLMNEPTAFSVWDGIRATTTFSKQQGLTLSGEVAIIGHSQGGGASLFAQQAHATYGDEFTMLGVVGLAPAPIWRSALKTAGATNPYLVLFVMYAYSASLLNPALDFTKIVSPAIAKDFPGWAAEQCLGDLLDSVGEDPESVFASGFLAAAKSGDFTPFADWLAQMDFDSPGNYSSDAPVLLVQGDADDIVFPQFTKDLQARLCSNGVNATLTMVPGDHNASVEAVDVYGQWLLERLYGYDAADGCP
jgi:pimeloyl-ACP methyl ester carboxylesterase